MATHSGTTGCASWRCLHLELDFDFWPTSVSSLPTEENRSRVVNIHKQWQKLYKEEEGGGGEFTSNVDLQNLNKCLVRPAGMLSP